MQTTTKTHRRRAYRKPVARSTIRLEMQDAMGNPRRVAAGLVDVIDGGMGLELMTPVESGAIVVVRGKLDQNRSSGPTESGGAMVHRKDRRHVPRRLGISGCAGADKPG